MLVPASDCQVDTKTRPTTSSPKPGGGIGPSETCPVSTKQERKVPICVSVLVFVFIVPTKRASCLIHKRRKKKIEKKAPWRTEWGEGKRSSSFTSEAGKLKELWFLLFSLLMGTAKPVKGRNCLYNMSSYVCIKHSVEVDVPNTRDPGDKASIHQTPGSLGFNIGYFKHNLCPREINTKEVSLSPLAF